LSIPKKLSAWSCRATLRRHTDISLDNCIIKGLWIFQSPFYMKWKL